MDTFDQQLDKQIHEVRGIMPQLRNEQKLTNQIMAEIRAQGSTHFLHRKWVRLVLNLAAVGFIAYFFIQTDIKEPSSIISSQNRIDVPVVETQAGKLLRQTTANEALPAYLGFLQQRSHENKAFRSSRPKTTSFAL